MVRLGLKDHGGNGLRGGSGTPGGTKCSTEAGSSTLNPIFSYLCTDSARSRVREGTEGTAGGRVAGREGGAGHRGRAEHRQRDRAGARALRGQGGVQRPGPGGIQGGGAADL